MSNHQLPFENLDYEKIKVQRFSDPSIQYNIFVSVASYRDDELAPTLYDMYCKAKNPNGIRTFCLMQTTQEDAFNINPKNNILSTFPIDFGEIDASLSKGVCWARAFCQNEYSNETYFLQIDSHMRFAHNWDETLIQLLHDTEDRKAILSCYPPGFNPQDKTLAPNILYNKVVSFEENYSPTLRGHHIVSDEEYEAHKLHQWIAAGFFFTYGNFCKEVQYDPFHYFIGEELDLTLRAYTRKWNSYAPRECVIWHYYFVKEKNNRVLHWDENPHWVRLWELSDQRIGYKLNMISKEDCKTETLEYIEFFQLGKERTLAQFEEALGINFKTKSIRREV